MFAKGYGVPKMPDAAFRLYYEVYFDNLKYFSQGDFLCKFADAALRLGSGCESGITPDYMESDYFYCLQADYAIRKRLNFDCFGDGAVYNGIQKALNESKESFHKYIKTQKTVRYTDWKVLCTPVRTYGRCAKAVIKKLTNGNVQITISATKSDYEFDARKNMILFTVPEADYCNLLKKITFKMVNVKKCEILNGKASFIYDNVDWDYKKGQHVFKCNGEEVARITADDLIWKAPKEDTKKTVKLRFAGVQFTKNGKEYDYLCDDKSIREGDTVIVEGINGETKVKVCKIFEREEIKSEIPESFYKSVIRKC